jgi:hypothetical protein
MFTSSYGCCWLLASSYFGLATFGERDSRERTIHLEGCAAMAQLVVMYKTPKNAAAFDKHYV